MRLEPIRSVRRWIWPAVRSPRSPLPFELKVRLAWRADMGLRKPRTFHELIRWRMLLDRRPLLTTFADKVAAHEYVARAVGPDVLPVRYAVVEDPALIDRGALPREFVVKASHGSGGVWLVTEQAPPDRPHPRPGMGWVHHITHPDRLDWDLLVAVCREWLAQNYAPIHLEWAYAGVPPRIIVEEFLGPGVPVDYKFFVFHGVPRLVSVDTRRFGDHRRDFFTTAWEPLDLALRLPPSDRPPPRPPSLDRMLAIAARLGGAIDFVRVDLYDLDGRIVFGELTVYPMAGRTRFVPRSMEIEIGRWWTATP